MRYKIETVIVGQGVTKTTNKKIEELVQPVLDKGTQKGWKLHSYTTQFDHLGKAMNMIVGPIICSIIWEIED